MIISACTAKRIVWWETFTWCRISQFSNGGCGSHWSAGMKFRTTQMSIEGLGGIFVKFCPSKNFLLYRILFNRIML